MDSFESRNQHIGVGATGELSLRISVATLVKVLFNDPQDGNRTLALERTATLRESQGNVESIVKAKPFGGAVRLIDPQQLMRLIGNFNYDSERSHIEGDFRILIHPASWEKVKEICEENSKKTKNEIIDSSPQRELTEEFEDTLNVNLTGDEYQIKSRGIIIEDLPVKTDNVRAVGLPTVRIYTMFEAWVDAPELINKMVANSMQHTDNDLKKMAWVDAQNGGRGRANAILTLGLDNLTEMYHSLPLDARSGPISFEGHQIAGNVLALLEEVEQTRYQRHIS